MQCVSGNDKRETRLFLWDLWGLREPFGPSGTFRAFGNLSDLPEHLGPLGKCKLDSKSTLANINPFGTPRSVSVQKLPLTCKQNIIYTDKCAQRPSFTLQNCKCTRLRASASHDLQTSSCGTSIFRNRSLSKPTLGLDERTPCISDACTSSSNRV